MTSAEVEKQDYQHDSQSAHTNVKHTSPVSELFLQQCILHTERLSKLLCRGHALVLGSETEKETRRVQEEQEEVGFINLDFF